MGEWIFVEEQINAVKQEPIKAVLLLALVLLTIWFIVGWWLEERKARTLGRPDETPQPIYHAVVACVMNFFDTLGIGSFATTTSMFKANGRIYTWLVWAFRADGATLVPPLTAEPGTSVRDEWIPGTLNVGYTIPTVAQALIYISIIKVDAWTLVSMIAASVAGAWIGASLVSRWPRRTIQIGMGLALLTAGLVYLLLALGREWPDIVPIAVPEGDDLALRGLKLRIGLAVNFALGALMTLGLGLYGPCLILVSLLGMNPKAAFPIMMGSCAFLMPVGGMRFIKQGSYSKNAAVVMSVAGIPGVLVAAYIVKSLDDQLVPWLIITVVFIAATMMLWSAFAPRKAVPREELTLVP